jgi:hypothetical protein
MWGKVGGVLQAACHPFGRHGPINEMLSRPSHLLQCDQVLSKILQQARDLVRCEAGLTPDGPAE